MPSSRESSLALTFDDGPDPNGTPKLLASLTRLGARATFFPIAARAAAHPDLIERMLRDGHCVGVHCDQHVRHSERQAGWVRRDTERALSLLRSVGVSPTLWRTPWGEHAPFSADIARHHGLQIIGWTVDTHDWRGDSAETMFASVESGLRDGAVVLAHDGIGPGAGRSSVDQTIALVELVAEHARRTGLALEAL